MKLEEVGSDSSYLKEDHAALLKPSYSYFDGGEGENLWFQGSCEREAFW